MKLSNASTMESFRVSATTKDMESFTLSPTNNGDEESFKVPPINTTRDNNSFKVSATTGDMQSFKVSATPNGPLPLPHHHRPLPFPSATTTTTTISLHQKPPFPLPDTELGVFSAERYFHDDGITKQTTTTTATANTTTNHLFQNPDHSAYPRPSLNPTTTSEASWNSRTGLLPPTSSTTPRARTSRWRLCPCSGKRSVDIEEKFSDFKSSYLDTTSIKHPSPDPPPIKWEEAHRVVAAAALPLRETTAFSFPILTKPIPDEDPPRDSLEVFRPREELSPRRSAELLRRWGPPAPEEMRRSFTFNGSPRPRVAEDDLASDASSDLFEIESFSTGAAAPAYRRRDSLDEEEPARPSGCYPPSEASVQWSVTTADGFASVANFSSAASDYGGASAAEREREAWGRRKGGGAGNGGLLLMSCRSGKAVNVAPHPVRHVAEGRRAPDRAVLTRSLSARAGRAVHGI